MILVNISRSAATAVTAEQIREAAVRAWRVKEDSLNRYGDYLVAVRNNVVIGVWRIERWTKEEDTGRFAFHVSETDDASLIGQPSPVPWVTGQGNPVKYVDTAEAFGRVEIENAPDGTRRAGVEGWTLSVHPDNSATLTAPAAIGGRLIVESANPGPGGSVTVRVLP